jgi:hypothetical protein
MLNMPFPIIFALDEVDCPSDITVKGIDVNSLGNIVLSGNVTLPTTNSCAKIANSPILATA